MEEAMPSLKPDRIVGVAIVGIQRALFSNAAGIGSAAMAHAARTFGGIDILINNVGGAIRMRPFAAFEPEQIDAEIRRSLMPTLYCCHAVLPHLAAVAPKYWTWHLPVWQPDWPVCSLNLMPIPTKPNAMDQAHCRLPNWKTS